MYRRLASDRLKGGEELQIGFVEGPDREWMSRLIPFLGHKEPWYEFHICKALFMPLDDLRTRFYIGTVRDEIVAHIMVVAGRGAAILGHVYTMPAWRRQGAVSAVMRAQMRDSQDLDLITLGTEYASAAYRIYHGFGFRPMSENSGDMQWLSDSGSGREFLAQGSCTVRRMRWDDWPLYNWATLQEFTTEPAPRSAAFGIAHRGSAEGSFLRVMQSALGNESTHLILEGSHGGVVGWCHLVRGQAPLTGTHLLDVHTLPGFESFLPALLQEMTWPATPVTFTMSPGLPEYADALAGAGFAADSRLSDAVTEVTDDFGALQIWVRNG